MRSVVTPLVAVWSAALLVPTDRLPAQARPTPVPAAAGLSWSASVRVRAESWRWFDTTARGDYAFLATLPRVGVTHDGRRWHWKLDVTAPILLGLPTDATLPAPAGQLGLGGSYAAASAGSSAPRATVAGVFLRQALVEWRAPTLTVRVGRMDLIDGTERTPTSAPLAALKAARIGQRLIGPFGFTHVQRAFDGVSVQGKAGANTFTAHAARPTSGVFTVTRAGQPLDVALSYGAWSRGVVRRSTEWDLRLFNLWYRDARNLVPVDTRPAAVRTASSRNITMNTTGGHLVGIGTRGAWRYDALAWGAVQRGTWSTLAQRAYAAALEAGVQRAEVPWAPWLRGGWYRGSGDADAADQVNGTFFQVTPTPRIYARFPYFNGMNSEERFVYLQVTPRKTLNARIGAHQLQRARASDLWWLGGGAFDDRAFGFVGRAVGVGTSRSLGSLQDASLEWKPSRRLSAELYAARVSSGATQAAIYGRQVPATFSYLELTLTR